MKTVIEMAREAGAVFPADGSYHKFEFEGSLERFAELVRADERAQRTWVGLTEPERLACYDLNPARFASAIEAKLKEKNT